jgi:hypothetical protein
MPKDGKNQNLYIFVIHEDEQKNMELLKGVTLKTTRDDQALIVFCNRSYKSFEVGHVSFGGKNSALRLLKKNDPEDMKKDLIHPTEETLALFGKGIGGINFFIYDDFEESHVYIANIYSYINSAVMTDAKELSKIDLKLLDYIHFSKDTIYAENEKSSMSQIEYIDVEENGVVNRKVKRILTDEVLNPVGISAVGVGYSQKHMIDENENTKGFYTRFIDSEIQSKNKVLIGEDGIDVENADAEDDEENEESDSEEEEDPEKAKTSDGDEIDELDENESGAKKVDELPIVEENPSKRRKFDALVSSDKEINLKENSSTLKIVQMLVDVSLGTRYDGFNASRIRSQFARDCGVNDDKTFARNLCLAFTAYARIGNNVSKLGSKRENSKISKEVMNIVNKMKIKKKANDRSDTTLPRIAIAFMPEYLVYRKSIAKELQAQTSSTISVEYQDIVFVGFPGISGIDGYDKFHLEFSSFIHNPKDPPKIDDEKFLREVSKWKSISVKGYGSDKEMSPRMQHAHNTEFINEESALTWISSAFNDKKYIK